MLRQIFLSEVSVKSSSVVPASRPPDVSSWGGLEPVYVTNRLKSFVLVGSFYLSINGAYRALVESLGFDPDRALSAKLSGFRAYECRNKNCGVERVYAPIVSCGSLHPHVSHRHSSRCVARVMEKIEFLEKHTPVDYLIKLDLTCPGWVSKNFDLKRLKLIRRAVSLFLLELRELLFHHKCSLGGFYTIHVWKTRKPLEPHLHVHLNLFNVAWNSRDKTFHRYKPFLDARKVKLAWRNALRSLGLWDNPLGSELPDCYVGYLKLTERARLVHRIRYVFRKPIVDLNENLSRVPEDIDEDWANWLIRYTPRQVFVGWAVNLRRFGFNSSKSFSEFCPVCGHELLSVGLVREVPDGIPWFAIGRTGLLVEIDPYG